MEIRHAVHPEQAANMGTQELRKHFLIKELFMPHEIKMVYSYYDRLIVGGAAPVKDLTITADESLLGAPYLLARREMGIINIGGSGKVSVDGGVISLSPRDGLYIGMGAENITFSSDDAENPACFYFNCAPAHTTYPTEKVTFETAAPIFLGEMEKSNKRTIRKYFHPDGIKSCQLVMGMTALDAGCVWNTMPVHTHQRRMEAYIYFDISKDDFVMHFMGEPTETRHIVVRNREVVLSPSWSIHSGSGTASYTFIWGMVGENQTFTDMDGVPMTDIM